MKPPFAYYGGKATIAPNIVDLLPAHEHYVEPFAGSLAVLFAKPRSSMETVNDLDGDLMTFWRVLRDQSEDLHRACTLTPHSRAELAAAQEPATNDLERARRVWVRLTQARSNNLRSTGWRYQRKNTGPGLPHYLAAYCDRMLEVADRLAGVSLEARSALEIITDYGNEPTALIYADPPYLASRSLGYAEEMTTRRAHRDLLDALTQCNAAVVISGYDSPLYRDALEGWHLTTIATMTSQGGARSERTELLWQNRPPHQPQPSLLDDWNTGS